MVGRLGNMAWFMYTIDVFLHVNICRLAFSDLLMPQFSLNLVYNALHVYCGNEGRVGLCYFSLYCTIGTFFPYEFTQTVSSWDLMGFSCLFHYKFIGKFTN